jgi:hypothetical protein
MKLAYYGHDVDFPDRYTFLGEQLADLGGRFEGIDDETPPVPPTRSTRTPGRSQLEGAPRTASPVRDGGVSISEAVDACKNGDIESLRSILGSNTEAGKSTDVKCGRTYLHHVVQCLDGLPAQQFLECLVEMYSTDVNARSMTGETPLHIAVKLRKVELAEMLVLKGANVDVETKGGKTPLSLAVANGVDTRLIELLIQNGATCDVEAINCRARENQVHELMGQNRVARTSSSVTERLSRGWFKPSLRRHSV